MLFCQQCNNALSLTLAALISKCFRRPWFMLNNSYYSYFFVEKNPTFSYFSIEKARSFFLLFGEWLLEGLCTVFYLCHCFRCFAGVPQEAEAASVQHRGGEWWWGQRGAAQIPECPAARSGQQEIEAGYWGYHGGPHRWAVRTGSRKTSTDNC